MRRSLRRTVPPDVEGVIRLEAVQIIVVKAVISVWLTTLAGISHPSSMGIRSFSSIEVSIDMV